MVKSLPCISVGVNDSFQRAKSCEQFVRPRLLRRQQTMLVIEYSERERSRQLQELAVTQMYSTAIRSFSGKFTRFLEERERSSRTELVASIELFEKAQRKVHIRWATQKIKIEQARRVEEWKHSGIPRSSSSVKIALHKELHTKFISTMGTNGW